MDRYQESVNRGFGRGSATGEDYAEPNYGRNAAMGEKAAATLSPAKPATLFQVEDRINALHGPLNDLEGILVPVAAVLGIHMVDSPTPSVDEAVPSALAERLEHSLRGVQYRHGQLIELAAQIAARFPV